MPIPRSAVMARPPFVPSNIAGLTGWWKADAITGLSDGDPISSWPDSGSNSNTGTQSGAARPTYKTNIVNGFPVARCAGGQYLVTPAAGAAFPFSMFAVVNVTSFAGFYAIVGANGANVGFEWRINQTTGIQQLLRQNTAGVGSSNTGLTAATWTVIAVTHASSAASFYLNGTADGTGSDSTTPNAAVLTFCGAANGDTMHGDVAEVMKYDTVLSSADRASVTHYLGTKYGITVT